jgi:hypothetical protein
MVSNESGQIIRRLGAGAMEDTSLADISHTISVQVAIITRKIIVR